MKRSVLVGMLIAVLVLGSGALAGCSPTGAGTTPPAGGATGGDTTGDTSAGTAVTIENFAFDPASVEIKVGDSVTWTNKDSATHTVDGDGGILSDSLATGASYTMAFDTAGTFAYKCGLHPTMTGTVVVK